MEHTGGFPVEAFNQIPDEKGFPVQSFRGGDKQVAWYVHCFGGWHSPLWELKQVQCTTRELQRDQGHRLESSVGDQKPRAPDSHMRSK